MGFLRLFLRAFSSAYQTIRAIRWKSGVSILTILFGAMGIAATFTISQNVDYYIERLINENGGPKIEMNNTSPSLSFSKTELGKFNSVSVIKEVYATDIFEVVVRFGSQSTRVQISPVTKENATHLPMQMKLGDPISPLDEARAPGVIVLSPEASKRLSPYRSLIGQVVATKIKGGDELRLRVIGIADPKEFGMDPGNGWVAWPIYRALTGRKSLSKLQVVAKDAGWMNWIESFGNKVLKEKFGTNVYIQNPLVFFIEQKNRLSTFIEMGYYLGLIALLAGSIGSTSLMIMSIGLRRREIGLYKAMGFSEAIILVQFTCETLILSLIGGVLGGVLGTGLGYWISQGMFGISKLSFVGFGVGIGSALVVGFFFGLIPAAVAARMDPVKALHG